jgi:2,3-diketo-5-methylthio-1-phosphopentane phosphatase
MIPDIGKARAILLDIEGTTSPVDFVHKKLFNYVRENLQSFLNENADDRNVMRYLEEIRKVSEKNEPVEGVIALMDQDSKLKALKDLQSKIWKSGFENGELIGEVYDDVPPAFKRWTMNGRSIFIYSSGSVESQKMLFQSTKFGDLTKMIDGYFDTAIGSKKDPESYEMISGRIGLDGKNIAFFSDSIEEIEASRESGINSFLVCRGEECPSKEYIRNFGGF